MNEPRQPIIYVTREIERALGMDPDSRYHIVTNRTDYGETMERRYPGGITLIEDDGGAAGTGDLMMHPKTEGLYLQLSAGGEKPYILVFKNTARIEPLAHAKGWTLLNPPAATSERVENKVSQVSWLAEAARYLPPHRIEIMKDAKWNGRPFVLQWAHGHTGDGTIFVQDADALAALATQFPERRARITDYVAGPAFTVNVIVTPETIALSTPSYQITGLPPFTDAKFATVGNDWGYARKALSPADLEWFRTVGAELGMKMQKLFWRGLFGIDAVRDAATGEMHLIEVNARQPASTTYESRLQERLRQSGAADGMTTFEAHLAALLGSPLKKPLIPLADGAQVIQRVTASVKSMPVDAAGSLELAGFETVSYQNTEENADLLRIQSGTSIMESDGVLNETGRQIIDALS